MHANIYETIDLLTQLGFTINRQTYMLQPTQKIEFPGFILESQLMTITLSQKMIDKIVSLCAGHTLFASDVLTAALPAVKHASTSFYRTIAHDQNATSHRNNGNFCKGMTLSSAVQNEMKWSKDNSICT